MSASYTASVTAGEIITDDPRLPEVRAVLERHLAFCLSETPPEHSFALDVDGLLNPQVTFVSYRDGDEVLGVAAIKELDAADVEVKSMHTTAEARGRGVGRALLDHLLDTALKRGNIIHFVNEDLQLVNADDLATIKHYLAFAKFGHSRLPIGLPLSDTTRDYFGKWNESVQQYQ